MLARIVLFGLALLGLWLIWRAVRQWNSGDAAARDNAEQDRRGRQLPHQRNDGSAPWIAAGSTEGTRSGARKSENSREPDAARDVNAPRVGDHRSGADSQAESGSGGGDSGGGGGSD